MEKSCCVISSTLRKRRSGGFQTRPHETTNPQILGPCTSFLEELFRKQEERGTRQSLRSPLLHSASAGKKPLPAQDHGSGQLMHRMTLRRKAVRQRHLGHSIAVEGAAFEGRQPRLLLRLPGRFLLRFAERAFAATLLKEPPRFTRFRAPTTRALLKMQSLPQNTCVASSMFGRTEDDSRWRHGQRQAVPQ